MNRKNRVKYEECNHLYQALIVRHNIAGIRAFSKKTFSIPLGMPGTVLLMATCENRPIAGQVYFQHGEVVHCHLGTANAEGYHKGAISALDLFSSNILLTKPAGSIWAAGLVCQAMERMD